MVARRPTAAAEEAPCPKLDVLTNREPMEQMTREGNKKGNKNPHDSPSEGAELGNAQRAIIYWRSQTICAFLIGMHSCHVSAPPNVLSGVACRPGQLLASACYRGSAMLLTTHHTWSASQRVNSKRIRVLAVKHHTMCGAM